MADEMTGGELRTKLETTLSENRTLRDELGLLKAKDVIATEGYAHVKPEDLKGVELDQLPARAKELQEARVADITKIAYDTFEAQGLQGNALDQAVDQFVNRKPSTNPDAASYNRARTAGGGGTPPSIVNPDNLNSRQKLAEGLKQQSNKRK